MNKSRKESLTDLVGGALVFTGGGIFAAYNIGSVYASFCKPNSYFLEFSDVLSVIIPAGAATWGAFSQGLMGAIAIRDHYKEKR